jgi:ribosome-associated translation inhibitor RaiA
MRINIHADGFELTSRLRAFVEERLLAALAQFHSQIEFVRVHLRTRPGHHEHDTTICEVATNLRPAGEVRVQTDNPQMQVSIDRAAEAIRAAVEREVATRSSFPGSSSVPGVRGDRTAHGALEIALDGNRISQYQREVLERPENYLRPVRIREYWRPPGAEEDTAPEELEHAFVGR